MSGSRQGLEETTCAIACAPASVIFSNLEAKCGGVGVNYFQLP